MALCTRFGITACLATTADTWSWSSSCAASFHQPGQALGVALGTRLGNGAFLGTTASSCTAGI